MYRFYVSDAADKFKAFARLAVAVDAQFGIGMVLVVEYLVLGANWRVKETDRLFAMATELRKVGAEVEEGEDYIRITPPAKLKYAEIGTYNDHRMAMCFSLVALSDTPVTILDPKCTAKTFPDYFEQLARISTLA